MRQRTWVWVSIGMLVATMLIGSMAWQGSHRGSLGQGLLMADEGGDSPGGGGKCKKGSC